MLALDQIRQMAGFGARREVPGRPVNGHGTLGRPDAVANELVEPPHRQLGDHIVRERNADERTSAAGHEVAQNMLNLILVGHAIFDGPLPCRTIPAHFTYELPELLDIGHKSLKSAPGLLLDRREQLLHLWLMPAVFPGQMAFGSCLFTHHDS